MKPDARRADRSVSSQLDKVEGKSLKCGLPDRRIAHSVTKSSEALASALQKVSCDAGSLVIAALERSGYTKDSAAEVMGISASLFTRQLQNADNQHVSLQRLFRLNDVF